MPSRNILVLALGGVFIYNLLFFKVQLGIGMGVLLLVLNIYFFLIRSRNSENLIWAVISSAVSVLFAFLFSWRSSGIIQVLDLSSAIFFSLAALYFYKCQDRFFPETLSFISIPYIVLKKWTAGVLDIFKADTWSAGSVDRDVKFSLIRGVAISLPILGVLLFLLLRADPIFSRLAENFLASMGERLVISGLIMLALLGFTLSKMGGRPSQGKDIETIGTGKAHELTLITGSVSVLFALFIVVQFRYLFSSVSERELYTLGISTLTYSEYVRRGFFELLISGAVASVVLIYALRYLHRLQFQKLRLQLLTGFLTFETGLILLSAAKRVALYADAHGLTRARVFGFIFLVWLVAILLVLLVKVVREMKPKHSFTMTSLLTVYMLFFINFINIDNLIATKYSPTVNNEIDYFYLTSISEDAYQSWKQAMEESERVVLKLEQDKDLSTEDNRQLFWTRLTLENLEWHIRYLEDKYGPEKDLDARYKEGKVILVRGVNPEVKEVPAGVKEIRKWQSVRLGEYQAYQYVTQNLETFKKLPALFEKISIIEVKVPQSVQEMTPIDRSTSPPLL